MRIESFLRQSPVFQVNRIARKMGASLNLILEEEGLTSVESLIMAAIFLEKKGGINPSRLAETFETTRGNVSHCLSSLEAKGLVQRRIDPEDARAFRLALLPKGRRQAARVVGILDRMQRQFEESVGARELQATLDQMRVVEDLCARLAAGARSSTPKGANAGRLGETYSRMILTKMPSGSFAPPRM